MEKDEIEISGACENNLKNVSLSIPKNKLVVIAGVSGSGKSSLAFDTIAVESSRQWQASYPLTPSIVVDQKVVGANSRSTVGTVTDIAPLMRLLFSRVGRPSAGAALCYSCNPPLGMCPDCNGLGRRLVLDESRLFDVDRSINENAILFTQFSTGS